jgi:hypothetical protein
MATALHGNGIAWQRHCMATTLHGNGTAWQLIDNINRNQLQPQPSMQMRSTWRFANRKRET